jgi:L-asparagine oxygenase
MTTKEDLMRRDVVLRLHLDSTLSQQLAADLLNVPSPYNGDFEGFLLRLIQPFGKLPEVIHRAILDFRCNPSAPGALLITGLEPDPDLPRTPRLSAHPGDKRTYLAEAYLLGMGRLVGEPFAYKTEKDGALIHGVIPTPRGLAAFSNEGSTQDFDFHSEVAFDTFAPHHVVLYCVRADHDQKAVTVVADIRRACELLGKEHVEALRQPDFQIRSPESFTKGLGSSFWTEPIPVLTGPPESLECRVNFNHTKALTTQGQEALDALRAAASSPAALAEIVLVPGSLLVINNRVCVHGRRPFMPRFDGFDRWLIRTYLRADLWPGRSRLSVPARVF